MNPPWDDPREDWAGAHREDLVDQLLDRPSVEEQFFEFVRELARERDPEIVRRFLSLPVIAEQYRQLEREAYREREVANPWDSDVN
ncbi:MAG: hypothetical protein HY039_08945 [Nitrospirae bacterium]|nr:hypothetical protein [Nitrospirota bacterium]